MKEELMTELDVMALLDHQNVVQIVDGYEDKKRLAIVTEMSVTLKGGSRK